MEKFLLRLFFPCNELHIVNEQYIRLTVFFTHTRNGCPPLLNGCNEFIGKVVAFGVGNAEAGKFFPGMVGDCVNEMGFAQPRRPVNQQGIVITGGVFRNVAGSGTGQFVGRPLDERFKGEIFRGECTFFMMFRRTVLKFPESPVIQHLNLKLHGKQIPQRHFNMLHEQGFNIAAFEIIPAVEKKGITLYLNGFNFVKPCCNGGLGKAFTQMIEDVFPNVRY